MLNALLLGLGWMICAFGQPAWSSVFSIFASLGGFACVFIVILQMSEPKKKFWIGTIWFAAVQALQLSWVLSHPFFYIYVIYFIALFIFGSQFGLLCMWLTPLRLKSPISLVVFPSFWVLMEWMRLYIFSGISWNPVGMALAGNIYSLQTAAL